MVKPDLVNLGPNLHLSIPSLIAGRLLIQANSGGGKSYAVRKVAEVTYGRVQQILLDVDGEYHTLREKYDYMLFGNDGEDYPISIKTAGLLARRLLETRVNAIIDLYELGTNKAAFIKPFLESLVQSPRSLWHPVLVFVDEAHRFAPEKDHSICRAAVEDLMTLGRKRGFTGVLATQRISKLSKDAAAECNNKLIGRSSLDIDMKRSADEIGLTTREDVRSLRKLTAGRFYAIGNAFTIEGDSDLVQIGKVKTTHLSAGETRSVKPAAPSKKIKSVFDKFADLPTEAQEEAKTVDELKAKIAELKTKISAQPKIETKVETTTIVAKGTLTRIEKLFERYEGVIEMLGNVAKPLGEQLEKLKAEVHPAMTEKNGGIVHRDIKPVKVAKVGEPKRAIVNGMATTEAPSTLKGGPAQILETLIQHKANGCTSKQIAVITGYKATSRYEYLRQLKSFGYLVESGDRYFVTTEGLKALPNVRPLPSGSELRSIALGRATGGQRKILELAIEAYPEKITADEIKAKTGYQGTSTYEYTRQLAASELVTVERGGIVRASDNLFDG